MTNVKPATAIQIAIVCAACFAAASPARADAQYKADRAYCMSGQASETRDLCLKEAAAAQADRQKDLQGTALRHKSRSAKQDAPAASGKSAGTS